MPLLSERLTDVLFSKPLAKLQPRPFDTTAMPRLWHIASHCLWDSLSDFCSLCDMNKKYHVHPTESSWMGCKVVLLGQGQQQTRRIRFFSKLRSCRWLFLSKTEEESSIQLHTAPPQQNLTPHPPKQHTPTHKHRVHVSGNELCSFWSSAWEHLIFIEGKRRRKWNNSRGAVLRVILHCNYDLDAGTEGALRVCFKCAKNICKHTHTNTHEHIHLKVQ